MLSLLGHDILDISLTIMWFCNDMQVKTALLTLVVVILLMVFLSAVDSFFRFLLASSMRRLS